MIGGPSGFPGGSHHRQEHTGCRVFWHSRTARACADSHAIPTGAPKITGHLWLPDSPDSTSAWQVKYRSAGAVYEVFLCTTDHSHMNVGSCTSDTATAHIDKGRIISVAAEVGVTPRYAGRLQAKFHTIGSPHVLRMPGRLPCNWDTLTHATTDKLSARIVANGANRPVGRRAAMGMIHPQWRQYKMCSIEDMQS